MKVLLINPLIPDYRIPIFNLLGNKINLTVLHSGKIRNDINLSFEQKIFKLIKIGGLFWSNCNLHKICKNYDIIVSEANIRYLDRNLLILNPFRKYKWITWGIGVSASYKKKINTITYYDFIRFFIFKRADANIFYSDFPMNIYIKKGFQHKTLFVANNTTEVKINELKSYEKNKILFVGTLYSAKNIYELLDSYVKYLNVTNQPLELHIIGTGPEYDNICNFIDINNLKNLIHMHGSIYDHQQLEPYFRSAYACISPGQAGLSVLTSMGYATPFITKNNAITGGEIFNIIDNYNGILYNSDEDLINILIDIDNNKNKFINYGINARKHYVENRQPEMMVNGFLKAFNFVISLEE